MGVAKTVTASEFKATCLDLLDRVEAGEFSRLEVTKRGRVVAVVTAPPASAAAAAALHGFLRGAVQVPEGVDLTAPVAEEAFGAARGVLHG